MYLVNMEKHNTIFDSIVDGIEPELREEVRREINKRTCRNCGREYSPLDSDAEEKEFFCCLACEMGI